MVAIRVPSVSAEAAAVVEEGSTQQYSIFQKTTQCNNNREHGSGVHRPVNGITSKAKLQRPQLECLLCP